MKVSGHNMELHFMHYSAACCPVNGTNLYFHQPDGAIRYREVTFFELFQNCKNRYFDTVCVQIPCRDLKSFTGIYL